MIWLGWVGFYGISTILGYLMPNPIYIYIKYGLVELGFMAYQPFNAKSCLYIYIKYMIWFGWVGFLWHINHFRLFNAKSSLYIYVKYREKIDYKVIQVERETYWENKVNTIAFQV